MRTALFIGGRSDYTGPAVRILPRTGARLYLSERWKVDDLINNNDREQQLSAGGMSVAQARLRGWDSESGRVSGVRARAAELRNVTRPHHVR